MQRVRPHVLSLDGPLVLEVAAVVEAVGHRLVLQVAFAALIADRAVQRMVDEKELHHSLAHLLHFRGVGVDDHAVGDRHGARRDWRGDALHGH